MRLCSCVGRPKWCVCVSNFEISGPWWLVSDGQQSVDDCKLIAKKSNPSMMVLLLQTCEFSGPLGTYFLSHWQLTCFHPRCLANLTRTRWSQYFYRLIMNDSQSALAIWDLVAIFCNMRSPAFFLQQRHLEHGKFVPKAFPLPTTGHLSARLWRQLPC